MSPILSRLLKFLNAALIFAAGAIAGFLGWQMFFAPFMFAAEAGRLTTELDRTRRVLEVLDRQNVHCARWLLASTMMASLDVSVPAYLKERMDQRFHDMLRTAAAKSQAYLDAHPELQSDDLCARAARSNPTVDPDAHKSGARGSP